MLIKGKKGLKLSVGSVPKEGIIEKKKEKRVNQTGSLGEKFIYFLILLVAIEMVFNLTGRMLPLLFFKIPALILFWLAIKEHREFLHSSAQFPTNAILWLIGGFFFALFLGFRWHSLPLLVEGGGVGIAIYTVLALWDKGKFSPSVSKGEKKRNSPADTSSPPSSSPKKGEKEGEGFNSLSPTHFQTPIFKKFAIQLQKVLTTSTQIQKWVIRHQIEEIGEVFTQLLHRLDRLEPSTQLIVELTSYISLLSQTLNSYLKAEGNLTPQQEREFLNLLSQLKGRLLEQILELERDQVVEFQTDIQLLKEQLGRLEKGKEKGN